jgi:hypothetical protein
LPPTGGVKDFLARTTLGDDFFAVTPLSCHFSAPLKRIEDPRLMGDTIIFPISLVSLNIDSTLPKTIGTTTYFRLGNNT